MTINTTHLSHPKYRPDIDGLRAIAVVAVIIFHAFPRSLKGGFIGVDVFFVISGYLISTIIFENLDTGTFSFTEFYSRRIRRIFPALILVLSTCFVFGWFFLFSDEYKQLGKHLAAGAGFISNIILWNEVGYFDNAAETKPLLHLWSLGIEEQFYIFWPLLLWFAWKSKFNLLTIIIFTTIISFVLNTKGVNQNSVATFYSPQTRFWELLSGSLLSWFNLYKKNTFTNFTNKIDAYLAFIVYREKQSSNGKTLSDVLSFLGLLLIVYGFLQINKELKFPGKLALIPVTGAAMLIAAGSKAFINRTVLSNKLVVWFGLISFPLYLWHWPLLSFARIIETDLPHRNIRIVAIIFSIILAWITYKIVEHPMRFGKYNKTKVTVLISLMTFIGYVGYYLYIHDGLSSRNNSVLIENYSGDIGHLDYHKYLAEKYFTCTPEIIAKESLKWEGFIRCIQSKPDSNVEIALVGDSHAEHLFLGLAEALPDKNIVFYMKNSPLLMENPEYKNIFDTVVASKSIKKVILTQHWVGRYSVIPDGSSLDKELIKIIDMLSASGKSIYLVDDVPLFPNQPILCKGIRWPHTEKKEKACEVDIAKVNQQRDTYSNTLNQVVKNRPLVRIINIGNYLCNDSFCSMTNGADILYRDTNHLNLKGSRYIGKRMVEDNLDIFRR